MKRLILAIVATAGIVAPAFAQNDDGRLYEEPGEAQHSDHDSKGSSKGSKWYGGVRPGFETHGGWASDYGGRRGFDHYSDRRGFDDRRENWLDGQAFALLDRWALWNFDYDRDGRLSRREYESSRRSFWAYADRDRDGRVTNNEYRYFRDRYLRRDFNSNYNRGWHNGWRW